MTFLLAQVALGQAAAQCGAGYEKDRGKVYSYKCQYVYTASADYFENPKRCSCLFADPKIKETDDNTCKAPNIPAAEPKCEVPVVSRDARTTPKDKNECQSICDTQFRRIIIVEPVDEPFRIACCKLVKPPVKPGRGTN
jgi:hypothetical protein